MIITALTLVWRLGYRFGSVEAQLAVLREELRSVEARLGERFDLLERRLDTFMTMFLRPPEKGES